MLSLIHEDINAAVFALFSPGLDLFYLLLLFPFVNAALVMTSEFEFCITAPYYFAPPFALSKASGVKFLSRLTWGAAVWELLLIEDRTGVSATNPQLYS